MSSPLTIDDGQAMKGRTGIARIWYASGYSVAGLKAAYMGEAAFRQLVVLNALLVTVAFMLDVSRVERAVMIAVLFLGLIVELLNSAIEATVDRISLDIHPLSKQAKDMGSAAQMLALALTAITWCVILL